MEEQSINSAIAAAAKRLATAGVDQPRRQASLLLGFVLNRDRAYLITHHDEVLSADQAREFDLVIERRANREPFQHITGRQEFFGLEFRISPDVLIPRPETELLVETALELIDRDDDQIKLCDVCTGSGAIAIALLHERPLLRAVGLDISRAALENAADNARRLGVADRLELIWSDVFAGLPADARVGNVPRSVGPSGNAPTANALSANALSANAPPYSLITANPPYITELDLESLQPEVRDFEPVLALSPGGDGLSIIRRIIADAPALLLPGGHLLIEIGYDQAEAVTDLIDRRTWPGFEILPDLRSIPRCVTLRRARAKP